MNLELALRLIPKIEEQANACGGWLELELLSDDGSEYVGPGSNMIRVARNAFVLWALADFDYDLHRKQRPCWTVISPTGVRLPQDSGLHTDWVLSARLLKGEEYGLFQEPRIARHVAIVRAVCRAQFELERAWSGASFVTLSRGRHQAIVGRVVHPQPHQPVEPGSIAIVPAASPAYQAAMVSAGGAGIDGAAGALICEVGGPLAHLATVGREINCTVLRLDDALRRYPAGSYLEIDVAAGTVALAS